MIFPLEPRAPVVHQRSRKRARLVEEAALSSRTPWTRSRRTALRIGKVALLAMGVYYLFCVALLGLFRFVNPPTTGVQVQRRIESWINREQYQKRRTTVPLERIPQHVRRAVVAAEDGRFWTHSGFDLKEMWAASSEVLDGDRIRGASTITQQLMKNFFGCACRIPLRKMYDVALTPAAELLLSKRRILELYLNNVEWGDGIYGIEQAARHYYGVGASDLTRVQGAGLAALLPNPRLRTPSNTPQYRAEILRRMAYRGW
jgi:monofunctional glycosyltransferase